jgi:hypothetical protein
VMRNQGRGDEPVRNVISLQKSSGRVMVQVMITETIEDDEPSELDWIQTSGLTAGFMDSILAYDIDDETKNGATSVPVAE